MTNESERTGLIAARMAAGYSNAGAARALGIPQKTYWGLEKGRARIEPHLDRLANFFKVDASTILGQSLPAQKEAQGLPHLDFSALAKDGLEKLSGSAHRQIFGAERRLFATKNPCRAMTAPDNPQFFQGDTLVFDAEAPLSDGDYGLIRIPQQNQLFFRICYSRPGGALLLTALDNNVSQKLIDASVKWEKIGKLAYLIRPLEMLR